MRAVSVVRVLWTLGCVGALALAASFAAAAPAVALQAGGEEHVPQTQFWVIAGAVAIAVAVCIYAAVGFMRSDRRFAAEERRRQEAAAPPAAAPRTRRRSPPGARSR